MALYEMRTYTLYVGKMAEATKLYQELGFPALKKGGQTGSLWATSRPTLARSTNLSISGSLMTTPTGGSTGQGSSPTRISWKVLLPSSPLVMTQEVKLLTPAPWGPHPSMTAAASTHARRCCSHCREVIQ
jgi:hypothetical protein